MTLDLQIRTRRAAFNRAIADGDAQAIGGAIAGRAAQVKVWQREFASA